MSLSKPSVIPSDILIVRQPLGNDRVQHGVEQRDVTARLECQVMHRMTRQRLAPGVYDNELGTTLGSILDIGRSDRMIDGRVSTDDNNHLGVQGRREGS